ncbi:NKG2-A/NKG2-B type II integral membrane protein-like [Microcaecilia unicolor]|uniref:NKG2-A/NKG2-B type II integral membrane protein-like n=1 Tax=Microcaecilia unicolor TaxID=1415580 RepID=A0A6P7X5A7_9AMPH|nr:NKG2-A/NKG2-B type II integral membrane protein-like [Microcaecilia unicolor]
MAETVTYSELRFGKGKRPKSSKSHSKGSSVLQRNEKVTNAAIRLHEVSKENVNPESAMTTTRQKALLQQCESHHWFYISLFLLILCLLFLIMAVTMGSLYLKCLNEASNQRGLNLSDKLEKLQPGEINRGQEYEFCPEEWRPWKGKCYFVSEEKKDWNASMRDCVSRDSHLALLKNSTDLIYITCNETESGILELM